MTRARSPEVVIVGAGKVGRTLTAALRRARISTSLLAARRGLPTARLSGEVIILATRESQMPSIVEYLRAPNRVDPAAVVLHVAGSLSSAVLAPLRGVVRGVAQFHPLIAFADARHPPTLLGAHAHVEGDPAAVAVARRLASKIGLRPRTLPAVDPVAYHAAAGLLANGAAALTAASQHILTSSGIPTDTAAAMLGPLLRSVAENVQSLGMPEALTGPVRRGDHVAVQKHRAVIARLAPELSALFTELLRAQLAAARALPDAAPGDLDTIDTLLG